MRLPALALLFVACAPAPAAPLCELGRVQSCPCDRGQSGTQECAPPGVWGVCSCMGADAGQDPPSVDVAAVDAPADLGTSPAACLASCSVDRQCADACRLGASDPAAYCCVRGRCVTGIASCSSIDAAAGACAPERWSPVCAQQSDCDTACGAGWLCARDGAGAPRCAATGSPRDAGPVDVAVVGDVVQVDVATDTGCPAGNVVCNAATFPTCVNLQRGTMRPDGRIGNCGSCGFACATGEFCERGVCVR